jgi:predicted TIM-barrel fold metal-dependent hydrolase
MIIDAHTHIFPPRFRDCRENLIQRDATFRELYGNPSATLSTADDLVAAIDEAGVGMAVAVGIGWAEPELAKEANDYLLESIDRYPDRLIGFCATNPAWGEDGLQEVERCLSAGLHGVGELHPDSQGFSLDDRGVMAPLVKLAMSWGVPVLVHASEPVGHSYQGKGRVTPEVLLRFIQNFPQTLIICAHWGGGLPFYSLMPEVAKALKNVYFDTAASPFLYDKEVFLTLAKLIGPQKILWGTDFPLIGIRRVLDQVLSAGFLPESEAMILGTNVVHLLGLSDSSKNTGSAPIS